MSAANDNALWSASDAAAATGGDVQGDWAASGISIDSRTLAPGDLFAALKGPNHDGHDHVGKAFERGAAAAMVDRLLGDMPPDVGILKVTDTVIGLSKLAEAARARTNARICGVTGSVGKTGTKELLAAALGAQGKTAATAGNLNNHYGLPLSLARMPADSAYGVFEMGMNHAGEISPLSQLARPHVAIITTIAPVHIENFESIDGIADAKAEIFDGLEPGGHVILNRDNPFYDRLADKARARGASHVWGFGIHTGAYARLVGYIPDDRGATVEAAIGAQHLRYRLSMRGKHWALNSLAVLAAAEALGADLDVAANALQRVMPPRGRGLSFTVQLDGGPLHVIDESYNASPIAMRAAFDVLAATQPGEGGRRLVALGDMLELGDETTPAHAGLAKDIMAHDFDGVFVCGQYMPALWDALDSNKQMGHAATSMQLAEKLTRTVRAGDVVMVKGSAGSHMVRVIDALRALGPVAENTVEG